MASRIKNRDDWIKQIQGSVKREGKYPDDFEKGGWMTFHELQRDLDVGHNKLRRILQKGVELGEIEAFEGTSPNITGRLCRSVWYKIIKLAKV